MSGNKQIQKVPSKDLEDLKKKSTIISRGLSDLETLESRKSGKSYMIGEFKDTGEPYYGMVRGSKMLVNDNGNWKISVLLACGEGFTETTIKVDEETFIKTMLSLGVSKEKIDEFIAYEIDWENF